MRVQRSYLKRASATMQSNFGADTYVESGNFSVLLEEFFVTQADDERMGEIK